MPVSHSITNPVRVRFAPSPTGHLHIGSLRTALFNWLFARHHNGTFLVRIEDTDRERSKQEYTDSILESLTWAGITYDESLVIQSELVDSHLQLVAQLLQEKKLYRCVCTQQEVAARCGIRNADDTVHVQYDGHCRDKAIAADLEHVVRFAIPDDQKDFTFVDLIRGEVTIPRDQLDDFIIVRSDGSPMYNFVVVADDAAMGITHVIRGEDHIANTPKQILLYQAMNKKIPAFAHIPLVLGSSGQRLSKRDAATAVIEYRDAGYLPEAFINYLARLGWSYGDQELFTTQELIDHFTLDSINKSGAMFDTEKLLWMNSVYIRQTSNEELYTLIKDCVTDFDQQQILAVIALYKDRIKTVRELADMTQLVLTAPSKYVDEDVEKWMNETACNQLLFVKDLLQNVSDWDSQTLSSTLKAFAKEQNVKLVQVAQPLRLSLVGMSSGPGVFDLLMIIGKNEVVKRIEALQHYYMNKS